MPSNPNQFDDIVHCMDNHGVLCNCSLPKKVVLLHSKEEENCTCNKCSRFIEHPKALEVARTYRESNEYKRAREMSGMTNQERKLQRLDELQKNKDK